MFVNVKGRVIEIAGGRDVEGESITVNRKTNAVYQQWTVIYSDKAKKIQKEGLHEDFGWHIGRPFYIISKLGSGRALEVIGGRNVVLKWKQYKNINQQFYFDNESKTIRSAANRGKALDIQNSGRSSNLQIWNANGRWWQMFKLKGENIVNIQGKALDVAGGKDAENQNVMVWALHNRRSQRWSILFVDDDKPEPKKGELNKEFGLYVEREFHLATGLPSGRFLGLAGRNMVIQAANGKYTQRWFFDQRTKTIRSVATKESWDIQNSGRSQNMQVWRTNSGWW